MNKNAIRGSAWALAAAAALGGTTAANAVDFEGYFRAGPGLTSTNNTARACYALNAGSAGMKYRLGNECDFYGEFQLSQSFKTNGIDTRVVLMTEKYTPATEVDDDGLSIAQIYGEAKGFDVMPQATFWIGKERGRRGDVHIVDTFFVQMRGTGAGFRGQPVGVGKLGLALYRKDDSQPQNQTPGTRVNLEYVDLPVGSGQALNLFFTGTKGDFTGGKSGLGVTARHDIKNLFGTGLSNMLWLQYAQGSASLDANFGDLIAGSAAKSWRIVESFNGQIGRVGGQALLLLASEKDRTGRATDSASVGGRVSYAFTNNFKLVTEVGYSQYKPEGGATAKLAKATIAPTLSTEPGFWSRPEFRLYVTTAKWNGAAGNVTGQPAFIGKDKGTSYGAQIEWWF